ncbi:putative lipoprotein YmbA [Chromobacterium alkanivorans]|uniref:PqiC family protein n=1 Tax=Chromobacterium alkanivorans TaxID=1071719 RepID=UPI002167AE54|nr:PqiC family protein [Chromobacterium alkanivorans]MCS3803771.1 putative lipoprotein YmbA [Chromobacterium alkanivorans]MCS3818124.1 putative lipoprotein YmbA [Chromobacterium alkanivorans]MCS3874677.1 putative lipoprotein YmbA [Chromobacterium alkanivorans]
MKSIALSLTLLALLSACASPPTTFHQLRPALPAAAATPVLGASVMVGPASLPAGLERPQLVVEDAAGNVELLDLQRWAGPLDRMLTQAVAADLSRALGLASVYAYPQPGMGGGDVRVLLDVRQLRLRPGRDASLEVAWQALPAQGDKKPLASGYFLQSRPLATADAAAATAGLQALVTDLSRRLAGELGPALAGFKR